jgi:hypothetical protein
MHGWFSKLPAIAKRGFIGLQNGESEPDFGSLRSANELAK